MSKTKQRILSVSRELFNEKGFANVTIRMIALKLNMSSGNLNYHFKKREYILEALYFEMVHVFDERIEELGQTEVNLKKVKQDVEASLNRMVDYRFFWTDLYNLLRQNAKIKSHFLAAYNERKSGYTYLFEVLIGQDILQDFKFKKESDFLIERMINYSDTWLYNSFIYEVEINQTSLTAHAENLLGMLYPYLTDVGKGQYKELFPKLFE